MRNTRWLVAVVGAAIFCLPAQANAITVDLPYGYLVTGSDSFQFSSTIEISGVCSSGCGVFPIIMRIEGTGPTFDSAAGLGWGAGASATITDNVGDVTSLGVSTGNFPGPKHEVFGSVLFPATSPSALYVQTSSAAFARGGPLAVDYVISISLPEGLYVTSSITTATPEPSTWAMMIVGFAVVGYLAGRRRRQASL